ncbi:hypothetical protein HY450_00175 [Candidatus Pacearchaeota archaeon]|nr:hypothetical protein [Candidatus Pacearchaeota archaeon]
MESGTSFNPRLIEQLVSQDGQRIIAALDELATHETNPDIDPRIALLFERAGLVREREMKGDITYQRTDMFQPFYERFKETPLYHDLQVGRIEH